MTAENLESTRLSDMSFDQSCLNEISNDKLSIADSLNDSLIIEESIKDDFIQNMDLSDISLDQSFEDEFSNSVESLNLIIAGKNKLIQKQQSKLDRLDTFVSQLLEQIKQNKTQEQAQLCTD